MSAIVTPSALLAVADTLHDASEPISSPPPSGVSARTGDPALSELLELFDGPLRDVTFPDVDRTTLRALVEETEATHAQRQIKAASLTEADEVLALAQAAVLAARSELLDADAQVDQRQRALLVGAQRALSYAKVFAETDPELHARLSAISLSRIAQRGRTAAKIEADPNAAPRKRGRPRKVPLEAPANVAPVAPPGISLVPALVSPVRIAPAVGSDDA